ncbi:hypothetical protein EV401DRAFT_2148854 [Pisolithus croceorrhizus]|nr:hypothetical protein EV401DRAFT_2148854 [Pisolithus croceorrhizus]
MEPPLPHPLPPALRAWLDSGNHAAQYHARSGWTYGQSKNTFERIEDDRYQENQKTNIYWPFQSRAEWRLGKFLVENLTQAQINAFLKLDWLEAQKPSFATARQLLDWMDTLPSGPGWKVMELEVDGYKTEKKIELIFQDGLEVVESLFGNPIFCQNMSFDPLSLWNNAEREYGEWFTAHKASRIQDTLPEGATIIPVITASDKTPVTRHTGALKMHPLFLTIANIDSNVRMKATACAWRCVAFMPVIKFDVHPDYQTILQARLWHKCMDIVMGKLKHTTNVGEFITDAFGDVQYCFTPLVAWTANLLEQQLITSVMDPWRLDAFQKLAKANHLLGVHLPFFRDWKNSDVSSFLIPEVLHSLHKFFFDHVLMWCKDVVGCDELDSRYKIHHKRIGIRHFASGVSRMMQMTGREHCDIQCTIVAMIAGAAPSAMVWSIHALINFIYLAQRQVHMESSIRHMENSLSKFHATKDAILNAGGRGGKDHFNIPKLELMLSFAGAVRRNGGLMQYSADVSERLLITHCKTPFTRTNRQSDFTEQIIHLLDRQERMHLMDVYLLLSEHKEPLVNATAEEEELLSSTDPTSAWISRIAPSEHRCFNSPRSIRNLFAKGFLSSGTPAALSVMSTPDHKKLNVCDVANIYALPDFATRLVEYISRCTGSMTPHLVLESFDEVVVWHKFCMQQYSTFGPSVIMPSQVVQALPPSPDFLLGNCDAILLNTHEQSLHNHGYHAAEVRTVFQLTSSCRSQTTPPFLSQPLLYVQPFNVIATPEDQPDTRLWILERVYTPSLPPARMGFVIPLTEVVHPADLVPVFGERVNCTVMAATSQQAYDQFYFNYYTTKEAFDTFYEHKFVQT